LIADIQVRDQVFLIWFRLFFTSNSFGSLSCVQIHLNAKKIILNL
jgi:hypothetical protein